MISIADVSRGCSHERTFIMVALRWRERRTGSPLAIFMDLRRPDLGAAVETDDFDQHDGYSSAAAIPCWCSTWNAQWRTGSWSQAEPRGQILEGAC